MTSIVCYTVRIFIMSHKKDNSGSKESFSSESDGVELRVIDVSESGLDAEVGLVGGQVTEIAKEEISEQNKGGRAKSKSSAQDKKKRDAPLDERLLLRERLLKQAPKSPAMREEVKSVLFDKKSEVEKNIRRLSRGDDFELLSRAVSELRHLVHQLELVAHASYELLKEIWLRVVHKVA